MSKGARLKAAGKKARTPIPANIDLVEWVRMRSRMSRGMAKRVILTGALKADSHILGFTQFRASPGSPPIKIYNPLVPADLRGRIEIVDPEKFYA